MGSITVEASSLRHLFDEDVGTFGTQTFRSCKCMGGRVFFGGGLFFVFKVAVCHWIKNQSWKEIVGVFWMGTNTCKCS